MSYEVVVEELRSAAGRYRSLVGGMAGYELALEHAGPESVGHVELAAWMTAVTDQCTKAGRALHDGALGLAGSLDSAAASYVAADQSSAHGFGGLLGGPFGSPFGTPQGPPFGPAGPLAGPVAGPVGPLAGPR